MESAAMRRRKRAETPDDAPGYLLVQRRPCATCIYRKECRLNLAKLEADIADPRMAGYFVGYRVCHHSTDVCCRGFWNRHRWRFTLGQLAQRLGFVRYVDVDTRPVITERTPMQTLDLRALRTTHHMSQQDLATRLGCYTANHLARVERGELPVSPKLARLVQAMFPECTSETHCSMQNK
jgi:DNA-binding XRE family transcriptional regulator